MKFLLTLSFSLFAGLAIAGQDTTYSVGDLEYEGYWSKVSDDAPLVVLVHDWDGLTDYEKKRAQMLNDLGYNVFAADLFGKGIRPTEVKDKKQHTGELYKDRDKLRTLMQASVDHAASLGGNKSNLVVMGYCFGGAAVLESARAGMDAKGFVTFHGGLKTPEGQSYSDTQTPILVLHGTADTAIPMEQFAQLAVELEAANVPHEMITYSGAPHAFTVFGSSRYQEEADRKSWNAFTDFLTQYTQ
ncbi:dienelactone hydrolase family protein [Vibrio sp. SCSIO 43135]|uniref:Dienelactone hydrolase family protein n=1 Tax=Vibrio paucivorans TaxID=2829489 RepID=A0A9X3HRR6_9VIBR|nr:MULTISPECIES: dienelactone hydrolase family protein [Vibrio]MCW8334149.1 dienelactone hydrolase family protein [Vibrio paucivorans]USD42926.1 dienelactone hydrolase family protein [Vibrio sp. SCSIO 43135]